MSELSSKQEQFCQLVASGETYAEAYRQAYPTSLKWKEESVWCESSKLMANTMVLQRVKEIISHTIQNNQVTIEEVLQELANWLRFDPLDIIDPDTDCIKRLADMDERARKSLAEIQVTEIFGPVEGLDGKKHREKIGELKKIKFIDKRATADMFMKKFGQYVDQKNVNIENLDEMRDIIKGLMKE